MRTSLTKWHCRCRSCLGRRKLANHPDYYSKQPRCHCGARSWRVDTYRHRTELPQIKMKIGRYAVCHADCFHFPHRMGSDGCKFDSGGDYR